MQSLREKGQVLLDQMSTQTSFSYGKDVGIENKENIDHIHSVMEDMQLRKQRFLSTFFMIFHHGHSTPGETREREEGLMCSLVFYRCEDMVDVRRLKMLQMVQLFKCEEDASQVRARNSNGKTL